MRPLGASDPRQVGPYRTLAELGRGGMGRVLLGSGPDGRLVAVKLVAEHYVDDDGFRARFRREVRASRQVAGAYTAAVIDADPEAPTPWLASVYVPGPALHTAVARAGALGAEAALRLAAGLAAALVEVHRSGLVHRDLKPSNVLLTDDGLRVIDFGIARAAEGDGTQVTRTGALVGTAGYMSPEQARGERPGPASDVFSLGSVLVYACTGHGPFAVGSTPVILHNVLTAAPELGGLPEPVRELARACLAKDPAARPTPGQLLDRIGGVVPAARPWPPAVHAMIAAQQGEVDRLLHGAPPPGMPYPVAPTAVGQAPPAGPSRRRFLAAGGAALGVAAVAGAAAWATSGGEAKAHKSAPAKPAMRPLATLASDVPLSDLRFSPDGGLLAAIGGDETVRLFDVAARQPSGDPIKGGTGYRARIAGIAFDQTGGTLATAGDGVKLWDVKTRRQTAALTVPITRNVNAPGPAHAVGYSPDGRLLGGAGTDLIQIWDAHTRAPAGRIDLGGANIGSKVAFTGDGRLLVTPDHNAVKVYDVASGRQSGPSLLGHTGAVIAVLVSPDGRTLASAAYDSTVRLWDVTTGRAVGSPLTVDSSTMVEFLAFSPDGRTLAGGGTGGAVHLWDVAAQRPVGKPVGLGGEVTGVAFDSGGRTLATVTKRTIQLWDLAALTKA
ncbi:WD40 repeat domain-containing serine/threonine protein kinase [Actinomadura macrotermitis]|uniref:Serine/threonine-protein kinase PknD n=1 Tax=Actinomadura macrotermitis TaxID=2585200 RepID=A0A7K0BSB1_9ACTN|nr:serine/threonine-protein kinase [Actinomadura macrotermitis]MQY03772.1 Serine/threonine-protein kinase PknD [Actinomadura macrotermitis]